MSRFTGEYYKGYRRQDKVIRRQQAQRRDTFSDHTRQGRKSRDLELDPTKYQYSAGLGVFTRTDTFITSEYDIGSIAGMKVKVDPLLDKGDWYTTDDAGIVTAYGYGGLPF